MIQRIQSLYMLVVAVLFGVLVVTPMADFSLMNQPVTITDGGLAICNYLLMALEAVVILVALVSIFFYKKRVIQIKLTMLNMVLILGTYPLLAVYLFLAHSSNLDFRLHIGVVFPLIAAILSYLAVRAIRKDEELVRSVNRIR